MTSGAVSDPLAINYNSDSNNPPEILALTLSTDPNGGVPLSITAQLTWNGTAQSAVTFTTTGHSVGDTYLLGLQVNSAVTMTSAYPWSVTVTAAYSGGNVVRSLSGIMPIAINNSSSPVGPGWSLGAADKLVTVGSDLVWVFGSGESRYFASVGNNAYLSPPNDFGTLIKNVGGDYTYTAKDQTKTNFNSSGQITSVVDTHGLPESFAYSGGVLNTVTEPDGGVGTFNYTGGLLTSVNEPGNRTVTLAYASGYLNTIQDPDGALETFTYDASHRLINDRHGPLNTTIGYDATVGLPNSINQGLSVAWTVAPAALVGLATTPAKNASQGVGVITDGLSHPTTYVLDDLGRTIKVQTADGAAPARLLDFAGQPVTSTDALLNVTSYTYDYGAGNGDLTKITHADATTEQFQYDGTFHHMTVRTDGKGNTTTMAYDATTGDLTTYTNALNQTTTYAYYQTSGHSNGLVLSSTDALGHTGSFAYDANRRMTQQIDGYGTSVATTGTMIYDSFGNLLSETTGISSTAAYDHHTTTSYGYDAMRRQTLLVEAFGTGLQRTTTTVYDGIGDVLYTTDALGNITSYAYDQLGRVTTHIDGYGTPVATTATMIYDNASNLLSETTGISSTTAYDHHTTTSFGYDAVNRQNKVISGYGAAEASTATMIFDLNGNLLSQTSGSSTTASYDHHTTTSYGYDVMNRQNKVIMGYGTSVAVTATMIYDQASNLLSETTGISSTASYDHHATTSYGYDALNRRQSVIDAYGTSLARTTTTAFDAAGNTLSVTDALNNITSYGYDALNRQTTQISAYGSSVAVTATMLYDAAGNLQSETTGISSTSSYDHHATTSYGYDALNRQNQVIQGYGTQFATTSTMIFDNGGNLLSETTGISSTASYDHHATTSFGYDALNRRTTEIDGYGSTIARTVSTVYDAASNVQARIDALGNSTTSTYDALNRVIAVQNPNPSGTSTTVYDAASNVVNTIDANNNKSTFAYDALNRQTSSIDALGKTTAYTFDAAGNRITLTDPNYNTTTFVFDTLNRLTQQTDALNHSATFTYSATDKLVSTTDRDNRLRTISYDALDRETGETWKVSGSTVNTQTFSYDAAGNELTAADNNGAYTMAYDVLNRMTSEQEPYAQSLAFTFDAAGNRLMRTDSQSGTATETYDALNRLVSYQYSAGTVTMSLYETWTKRDQLNTQSRYSDLSGTHLVGTTSYGYDNAGRETNLQFKDGSGNNISNFTFSYDPGNRLTAETLAVATLAAVTTSYQYDADNQLKQAGTVTYGYDSNGNRTVSNGVSYSNGTENQLTTDGTWTYTYDSEGNLTQKSKGTNLDTWNYGYDNVNRLTSATEINAGATLQQATYKYDVFGNRIDAENTTTTITHFAYDGANAWADFNSSNVLQTRRLYTDATDALFARIAGSTVAWYLTDRLGSIRDIANNSTGLSIDHLDYDGFGQVATESNTTNGDRYKYTARELDSQTGLQYNRKRYYGPNFGRWTSQDPMGFNAGDSNLYRYVRNNPTNARDPQGLGFAHHIRTPGPKNPCFKGKDGKPLETVEMPDGRIVVLSKIRLCWREIDVTGLDKVKKVVAGSEPHAYLDYGKDANGVDRGFGLWNTDHKKGDLADSETVLPVLPPYKYWALYKDPAKIVHGGSGDGKKATDATDDEIWDSIVHHRLTHDYTLLLYTCYEWANEALQEAGLINSGLQGVP